MCHVVRQRMRGVSRAGAPCLKLSSTFISARQKTVHVAKLETGNLTLRLLMSYIYIYIWSS